MIESAADEAAISEWRRGLLQGAMRLGAGFAVLATIVLIALPVFRGQWNAVEMTLLVVMGTTLVVVALWRNLPIRVSSVLFIIGAGGICLIVVSTGAFNRPIVLVALELLVSFVVLLVGTRAAWLALGLTDAVLATIGALHVSGVLSVRMLAHDSRVPATWVAVIVMFTLTSSISIAIIAFVTRRLEQELLRSRQLKKEVESQSQQLIRAERLEALATLAGGMAHEFNSLLSVITANIELATAASTDPSVLESLQESQHAVLRGGTLTRDLIALSRQGTREAAASMLTPAVAQAVAVLRKLLPERITLVLDEQDDNLSVNADARELEQVVMNLVVNARDALQNNAHGRITLSVSRTLDGFGKLTVKDNGSGMSNATRERIFEPFFTTKDRSRSPGLGLSVVHGLVTARGGRIEVESAPNEGAVFSVYFPLAAMPEKAPVQEPKKVERAVVLIAEDDQAILKLIDKILQHAGYETIPCPDGVQALAVLQSRKDIALVVSDVIMPELDGRALHDKAVALDPKLRFLFCSGYTSTLLPSEILARKESAFIAKPFMPSALVEKVRSLLGN